MGGLVVLDTVWQICGIMKLSGERGTKSRGPGKIVGTPEGRDMKLPGLG